MHSKLGIAIATLAMLMLLKESLIAQCFIPVNQRVISLDTQKVELQWVHSTADSFDIEIRKTSNQEFAVQSFRSYSANITIQNLEAGTAYDARIRAYCPNGQISNWTSRIPFITHFIHKEDNCHRGITIMDRNCGIGQSQQFNISVTDYEDMLLGQDIQLLEVRLLIEHNWPSDMRLVLVSPSGQKALLSNFRGLGRKNFGDITSSDCSRPLIFTPLACQHIATSRDSLVGYIQPEENFDVFNDFTLANGLWTLEICDQVETDIGILQQLQLVFSDQACIAPTQVDITDIGADFVLLNFGQTVTCDSFIIELCAGDRPPGKLFDKGHPDNILEIVSCSMGQFRVEGLQVQQDYQVYIRSKCLPNKFSDNTCGISFTTLCNRPAIRSKFDHLDLCSGFCDDPCHLDGIWENVLNEESGLKWTVHSGSTPTIGTGPDGDVFQFGKYIYIEPSDPSCTLEEPAQIISPCIVWEPIDSLGCDMSFFYHMYGVSSGQIVLEASTQEGYGGWETLWSVSHENQSEWRQVLLNLESYKGVPTVFRFSGTAFGNFSDIALDEISFLGAVQIAPKTYIYFADKDGDGYGDPSESILSCLDTPPPGYSANNLDCDDDDPRVNPGAEEIPCNGVDDNCSGVIDDAPGSMQLEGVFVQDETCLGAKNGRISISISGGTAPFEARWSDGGTGFVRNDLSLGHYSVTVEDFFGCFFKVDSIYVHGNNGFEVDIVQIVSNTCPGIPNGMVVLNASGGVPPYLYEWEDGYILAERSQLAEGLYLVTVSDQAGCKFIKPILINPISRPQIQVLEIREPTCPDKSDGLIRVRVPGGVPPIQYLWSNGSTTQNATQLLPGTYSVTITEGTGCQNTGQFELKSPPPLSLQVTAIDPVSCPGGQTGRIHVRVQGGTPPLNFNWNNGYSFSPVLLGAGAGVYELLVTDAKNCSAKISQMVILGPDEFVLDSVDIIDNRCLMSEQGKIKPYISGGTPDYLYFWSNGATSQLIEDLSSGNYQLTISDLQNCKHTFFPFSVRNLQQPLAIQELDKGANRCFGDEDGYLSLQVSTSSLPIQVIWSTGKIELVQEANLVLNNLKSGTYGVTITDREGCIGQNNFLTVDGPSNPLNFQTQIINPILCQGEENGKIRIIAMGGTPPYRFEWSHGFYGDLLEGLGAGNYQCTVIDYHNCTIETPAIQLNEPDPLSLHFVIEEDGCEESTGKIRCDVMGGTAPYDIKWLINGTEYRGPILHGVPCGWITVLVSDDHLCAIDSVILFGLSSTDPVQAQSSLNIYPMPASHVVQVESDMYFREIVLFSAHGGLIKKYHFQRSKSETIPVDDLQPGLYLLKTDTQYLPQKLIIQR